MSDSGPPPSSFMHWLGRQVGHIRKAIRTQLTHEVVYRKETVQEQPAPDDPSLTLRRTTTDEVLRSTGPSTEER